MAKYLYIVNPTSGKGRGKKAIHIIQNYCESHNKNYKLVETKYRLHAKEITELEGINYSHIISVGGDGTLNEVVNGIRNEKKIILGMLPVGSGNDFVKNIGLGNSILDNMSIIHNSNISELASVDVGIISFTDKNETKIKEHKFINNLGIGFDAFVGKLNQQNKVLSGVSSYIYSVIKALFNYKMINLEINFNGIKSNGEKLMLSIGNGISSGGGFYLNPRAEIDDGQLDISVFDKVTRRRLLTALPLALLNKIDNVPEAKQYRSDNIHIKLKSPYYAHCDGEIISEQLEEATIKIDKQFLRIIKKMG